LQGKALDTDVGLPGLATFSLPLHVATDCAAGIQHMAVIGSLDVAELYAIRNGLFVLWMIFAIWISWNARAIVRDLLGKD
jgi:hypothetical protein